MQLHFTICDYNIFESEEKLKAVENLVKLIRENNGFMKVGVLGGKIIFRVLADYGYADLAYNMISRFEEVHFFQNQSFRQLNHEDHALFRVYLS